MNAQVDIDDIDTAPTKFTTADVNDMLWRKFTDKGEHIVLFNVPDQVGTSGKRYCDAVAIGMWGSSGREIHGFEIKVSRGDWLRELRQVDKADPFIKQCDRWSLITADASIAKLAEIPASWGWATCTKNGIRWQRPATPNPSDHHTMPRLWAYALIRKAFERGPRSAEWQAALRQLEAQKQTEIKAGLEQRVRGAPEALVNLQARVDAFEKASGMKLEDWRLGDVGKLARRIHEISEDGYRGFRRTLQSQAEALQRLAKDTEAALSAVDSPALGGSDDL